MKFIQQSKTGSASSGPLWFALNTTSSQAVKGSVGPALDDGGGGIEGGGGDVTPNAANWTNTEWFVFDPFGFPPNNSAQITGISSTIQVRLRDTTSGLAGAPTVRYRISASAMATNNYNLNSGSWTVMTFTGTAGNRVSNAITVANNEHIGFVVSSADTDNVYTFEVQNVSSSNTVLDTFTHVAYT